MNKRGLINKISEKLECNEERSIAIESVFEDHFIIGINNKEKILADLIEKIGIDKEEADNIYNTVSEIIVKALKDKIIHPFRKD